MKCLKKVLAKCLEKSGGLFKKRASYEYKCENCNSMLCSVCHDADVCNAKIKYWNIQYLAINSTKWYIMDKKGTVY
ncbi:hypothetical protein BAC7755_10480 [Bacillus sp. MN7755]